ncbi:hypothetical protein [Vallicoccus soli]|uniref:Uncharacterized protein n=1 Tax=Vallicoccus soli TaxID=2339232 RepID=A0A3A3YUQ6_9ACTN|nr:hypothetical protein [Vallicoccus soli]RJK92796.1 hypothetical protein D5H78_18250 [Vallicoccus soli]
MSPRALALLGGLLACAPALHGAYVTGAVAEEQALSRSAVVLLAALVAGHLLHALVSSYAAGAEEEPEAEDAVPARRSTDLARTGPPDPLEAQP